MIEDLSDPRRIELPYVLDEWEMLEAWLEFHRTTLLLKCEGLDDAGRKRRAVPTSKLSLHGLVRHAEGERNWFRRNLLRDGLVPFIWRDPAVEDTEFFPLDDADWATDVALWRVECEPLQSVQKGSMHFMECFSRIGIRVWGTADCPTRKGRWSSSRSGASPARSSSWQPGLRRHLSIITPTISRTAASPPTCSPPAPRV